MDYLTKKYDYIRTLNVHYETEKRKIQAEYEKYSAESKSS
jgi:hypothetical protein